MENVAVSSKSILLALLMVVMIIFPKPLFCEATQLPHRGIHTHTHRHTSCLCCFYEADIRYIISLIFFIFVFLIPSESFFFYAELLQHGGTVCPDCVCCEDPRPSVRRTPCCACCPTSTTKSDKGLKGTRFQLDLKLMIIKSNCQIKQISQNMLINIYLNLLRLAPNSVSVAFFQFLLVSQD